MRKLLFGLVLAVVSTPVFANPNVACPCQGAWNVDFATYLLANPQCVDYESYSKSALGHGHFQASLEWFGGDQIPRAFISDGGTSLCGSEGFGDTTVVDFSSTAEERACIASLRDFDNYLGGLPSCTP